MYTHRSVPPSLCLLALRRLDHGSQIAIIPRHALWTHDCISPRNRNDQQAITEVNEANERSVLLDKLHELIAEADKILADYMVSLPDKRSE